MYSSEYASGFSGPAASHLAAPPSPRHEGNVGQAPIEAYADLYNFKWGSTSACFSSHPLLGEPCCVLTSLEMTCVIRSASFGWGVSKSTPNVDLLTHFTVARSIRNSSGSPGTKICRASTVPTETDTFPVM